MAPAQPHDYALAGRKPHNGTRRASTLALARLVDRKAKPGGAVNDGAQAPFISTVDCPARFCYQPDKLEFVVLSIIMHVGIYNYAKQSHHVLLPAES